MYARIARDSDEEARIDDVEPRKDSGSSVTRRSVVVDVDSGAADRENARGGSAGSCMRGRDQSAL